MSSLRSLIDPLYNFLGGILQGLHSLGAPWWLSILLLTLGVRTLLFPLTVRQVKSMRRMQELKPALDEIKKQHKGDAKKQQEETMKLYGEHKVNPLGGCLPVLVQLPVFLVLYYTIRQFDKLESFRTGGLLWFQDLTVADPYFILPIIYVVTMVASQEVTIRRTNPQQKQLMRMLPVVFGFFLSKFPAGLLVYSITTSAFTFVQNYLVYRNAPKPPEAEQPTEPSPKAQAPKAQASSTKTSPPKKATEAPPARRKRSKKKSRKR